MRAFHTAYLLLGENQPAAQHCSIRFQPAQAAAFKQPVTLNHAISRDHAQFLLVKARIAKDAPASFVMFAAPDSDASSASAREKSRRLTRNLPCPRRCCESDRLSFGRLPNSVCRLM